jgi:hypothetical protein
MGGNHIEEQQQCRHGIWQIRPNFHQGQYLPRAKGEGLVANVLTNYFYQGHYLPSSLILSRGHYSPGGGSRGLTAKLLNPFILFIYVFIYSAALSHNIGRDHYSTVFTLQDSLPCVGMYQDHYSH